MCTINLGHSLGECNPISDYVLACLGNLLTAIGNSHVNLIMFEPTEYGSLDDAATTCFDGLTNSMLPAILYFLCKSDRLPILQIEFLFRSANDAH